MASYISYLPCIINSSVFFGSNIPSVVTDISMRFWPPSLQILTQMNDSDQSFPTLKLVSLSASTELMLRSCSGLWTPLMVWVVKADATCYGITCCCYLLFILCCCCLGGFEENADPWPWGALMLLMRECRRGVKWEPEVRGGWCLWERWMWMWVKHWCTFGDIKLVLVGHILSLVH